MRVILHYTVPSAVIFDCVKQIIQLVIEQSIKSMNGVTRNTQIRSLTDVFVRDVKVIGSSD